MRAMDQVTDRVDVFKRESAASAKVDTQPVFIISTSLHQGQTSRTIPELTTSQITATQVIALLVHEPSPLNRTELIQEIQSMPIVPVRLQWMDKQIFTYAMLDSCSTGTFITDETRKKREVEGVDIEILIRTMNGQELHNTKAVAGLLISDISGKNAIQLPRTFTKEEIPASEKDIPQRELARKWKHPEQIADQIPDRLQDSEVGVLIGTNCQKAIEPRDFITKIM